MWRLPKWRSPKLQLYGATRYKRSAEALLEADAALALDQSEVIAWNDKGIALERLQRPEEALTAFDQALTLDPQDAAVWNNQSLALIDLARFSAPWQRMTRRWRSI